MATLIERVLFALSAGLLAWLALRELVPAHPIEQPVSLLLVSAAMACSSGASLLRAPMPRRVLVGASVLLVAAAFWWL